MKAYLMVTAVALAGVGLAGSALAYDDCQSGPFPPSGYREFCLFDDHAAAGSDWYCDYAYSDNSAARAWMYDFFGALYFSQSSGVHQYTYDYDCDYGWGYAYHNVGDGTEAYTYNDASGPGGYTYGGAYFYQYAYAGDYTSPWGGGSYSGDGTNVGAYRYVGTPFGSYGAEAYFAQWSYNGGACEEYAFVGAAGQYQAVGPQPCTHEIPDLMDAGAVFPDWPDGTGAPFL